MCDVVSSLFDRKENKSAKSLLLKSTSTFCKLTVGNITYQSKVGHTFDWSSIGYCFLCIITELSQIQGPTGWHTMLLIYRIREFSFQKNNYALVLLTQLIKLMVDVTHTIYMSVLLVVLLKETLITVVSYCYSSTFLLCRKTENKWDVLSFCFEFWPHSSTGAVALN